ncbi:isoprenylcysteine carboxylmethyltransferase family protein [Pseudomonas protegens]|uniref:methanethiol S-methyltransferase n=1 Tax=Pseudomonas protegens TaxID=380021 RepID=UPI002025854B|nr:methanethiol S-methyltransferase [Pseudomonas protegens]MCL9658523.1 isoprenylcysteine carboxylmethyltransferase family protein [Pseudomonas protegens]
MNADYKLKKTTGNTAKNLLYLLYSLCSYVIFLLTFLYLIGFLGSLLVPKNIDSGVYRHGLVATVIDIALITLFAVQHSVMAREGFKKKITRIIPAPIERATYVLCSSLMLILLFILWQPIPAVVWTVQAEGFRGLLNGLYWAGWGLALMATFLISHLELFGLKQAYRGIYKTQPEPLNFITPFLYNVVRHPMYLGFLITFWATPEMTVGHLVFALTCTAYIFVGTHLEEKDMARVFGKQYLAYKQQVGMLLPSRKKT